MFQAEGRGCEGFEAGEDLSHWRSTEEVGLAGAQGAALGVARESCFLPLPAAGTKAGRKSLESQGVGGKCNDLIYIYKDVAVCASREWLLMVETRL